MPYINKNAKYPVLMIQRGKHGNAYYLINSKEHLINECWDIFKTNLELGYYSSGELNTPVDLLNQEKADLYPWEYLPTKEDTLNFYVQAVNEIENGSIPSMLLVPMEKKPEFLTSLMDVMYWKTRAYEFLQDRNDCEYERLEIERFSN